VSQVDKVQMELAKYEEKLDDLKKSQAETTSDMFWWSYMKEIEALEDIIARLKEDLRYELILEAVDDVIDITDTAHYRLRIEIENLIRENKRLKRR